MAKNGLRVGGCSNRHALQRGDVSIVSDSTSPAACSPLLKETLECIVIYIYFLCRNVYSLKSEQMIFGLFYFRPLSRTPGYLNNFI